eukprot:CAMPEP_0169390934 /NCGR_PEP_ID=MMETSP1017-20121227/47681_1 /TAXON_ID=342587 /ORGANISM="Karlodinium micrum, Strain CCMP2283" /LENGTH=198 /DNA_ID=CAMNT_0009493503 /DNA_START=206 /DNA_END=800 /DNA_ORIENTATION=+
MPIARPNASPTVAAADHRIASCGCARSLVVAVIAFGSTATAATGLTSLSLSFATSGLTPLLFPSAFSAAAVTAAATATAATLPLAAFFTTSAFALATFCAGSIPTAAFLGAAGLLGCAFGRNCAPAGTLKFATACTGGFAIGDSAKSAESECVGDDGAAATLCFSDSGAFTSDGRGLEPFFKEGGTLFLSTSPESDLA